MVLQKGLETGKATSFLPPEVFCKEDVLKHFANFIGKHLCWSLFLIKLQALRLATLIKKRLEHGCFPMKFVKILRTPILKNICERLSQYYYGKAVFHLSAIYVIYAF